MLAGVAYHVNAELVPTFLLTIPGTGFFWKYSATSAQAGPISEQCWHQGAQNLTKAHPLPLSTWSSKLEADRLTRASFLASARGAAIKTASRRMAADCAVCWPATVIVGTEEGGGELGGLPCAEEKRWTAGLMCLFVSYWLIFFSKILFYTF